MPVTAGRAELIGWLDANTPRFPDWETAIRELAAMTGSAPTPALEAYARALLTDVNGEIRDPSPPERMADLILAVFDQDVPALAARLAVPTLLIACGEPAEHRPSREKAWRAFAAASPLVELHVADGWTHNPILQDPEASSSLIGGWLQQHLA